MLGLDESCLGSDFVMDSYFQRQYSRRKKGAVAQDGPSSG
jgi:hypothetical protein